MPWLKGGGAHWHRPAGMPVPPAPGGWVPPVHEKPDFGPVRCWLYVNLVWDPDRVNTEMLGYIGESVRPAVRTVEHQERDPWGDTMTRTVVAGVEPGDDPYVIEHVDGLPPVPAWVLDVVRDRVAETKTDMYRIEQVAVLRYLPPYNGEYNWENPGRITKRAQIEARARRDAARGLPVELTWAFREEQRQAAAVEDVDAAPVTVLGRVRELGSVWRRLPDDRRRAVGWAGGWLAGTLVEWWMLARVVPGLGWRGGGLAGVAFALLLLWLRWRRRPPRRLWTRMRLAMARAALVVAGVWMLIGPVTSWLDR